MSATPRQNGSFSTMKMCFIPAVPCWWRRRRSARLSLKRCFRMEKSRQGKLKLRWQKHKKLKAWDRSGNKPEKRCQSAARMCGKHPGQPSDRWKWQWRHLLLCKFQADFAGYFGRECWFAQKRNRNKTMFVHTYFRSYAIIIDVTPPIHYIVFATPHKTKYLLLKRSATPLTFFIS